MHQQEIIPVVQQAHNGRFAKIASQPETPRTTANRRGGQRSMHLLTSPLQQSE